MCFDILYWVYSFDFNRITVGAYRIRPDVGEKGINRRWLGSNFIEQEHVPCHEGRMRYAPTLVRWKYLTKWLILVVIPCHEGRMRYASTPFRRKSWTKWIGLDVFICWDITRFLVLMVSYCCKMDWQRLFTFSKWMKCDFLLLFTHSSRLKLPLPGGWQWVLLRGEWLPVNFEGFYTLQNGMNAVRRGYFMGVNCLTAVRREIFWE